MAKSARRTAAVIGAGWVATARHIPSLLKDDRVRIAAVYDRDPRRAQSVARRFGIPLATSNLEQAIDAARDIVTICTPPAAHAPLTIQALQAGRHVMVEKPMAMTVEEARKMIETAERGGLRLCVSHNLLYSRSVQRALRALRDAGPIQHAIGVQLSNPDRRLPAWYHDLPGGLFFDESPHMLYLLARLLGDATVDEVWTRLDREGTDPEIDLLEARLSSQTAGANLTMAFSAPVSEWTLTIITRRKVITLDLFRDIATVTGTDGRHGPADVMRSSFGNALQSTAGFISSGARYSLNRLLYGHDRLYAAFIDSIEGGEPAVPLGEALAVVETTADILGRASLGQPALAEATA